ncbi:hypothetical protein Tco_0087808 [Tanacetum coccineum]
MTLRTLLIILFPEWIFKQRQKNQAKMDKKLSKDGKRMLQYQGHSPKMSMSESITEESSSQNQEPGIEEYIECNL